MAPVVTDPHASEDQLIAQVENFLRMADGHSRNLTGPDVVHADYTKAEQSLPHRRQNADADDRLVSTTDWRNCPGQATSRNVAVEKEEGTSRPGSTRSRPRGRRPAGVAQAPGDLRMPRHGARCAIELLNNRRRHVPMRYDAHLERAAPGHVDLASDRGAAARERPAEHAKGFLPTFMILAVLLHRVDGGHGEP